MRLPALAQRLRLSLPRLPLPNLTLPRVSLGRVSPSFRPLRRPRLSRPDGLTLARWGLVLLAGLFLGGIIHILVVMRVPSMVHQTAHARVAEFGPDGSFNRLPDSLPGAEPLPLLDPQMLHAACRFDLDTGPVRIMAALPPPFWSFALFNAQGEAIYSLNDRTSGNGGTLDVLVLTSAQLSQVRENPPIGLEDMIVIETAEDRGYALLRAFGGDPVRRAITEEALAAARCTGLEESGVIVTLPAATGTTPAGQ
ncbi:DUF1254 domain-containing protein [Stappia indica]|uniref:DUF1254 domain-containing protein n=1 Tax=Stappia indica TaxID=538381 RepID=UPI001CD38D28|nr:hypothetical protein [Stappia indica]MCA1300721.1 hypothetical protein [Stappia indica]